MNTSQESLKEIAARIREMRAISGFSIEKMAGLTDTTPAAYAEIEAGKSDPPFSFLHKCAIAFGMDIMTLLEGHSAKLSHFQVNRAGTGPVTVNEPGILIRNMAAMFKDRLATPYFVTYDYDESLQSKPMQLHTHGGQEFDYVVSGQLKVRVGDHETVLNAGDSIFYKSSTPHAEIAVGGQSCTFVAMIMAGNAEEQALPMKTLRKRKPTTPLIAENYVTCEEDAEGRLKHVSFKNTEKFNFTFRDMSELSNRIANYFVSLGCRIEFMGRKWRIARTLKKTVWLAIRPENAGFYVLETRPDPTDPVVPRILAKYRL